MIHRTTAVVFLLAGLLAMPASAGAQAFGFGPRMSFVRGDVPSDTPSTRFFGGTIRMNSSKHVAIELAMDYRSQLSPDGLTRLRDRPFQGSLLLYPIRSTFSPYLLAGYGLYQETTDTIDVTGLVTSSTVARKTGAHLGFGAEILLTRHTAFYLDYRYTFVKFGAADTAAGDQPLNIPGSSIIPGLSSVQLSHQGSMITSGVAFYF